MLNDTFLSDFQKQPALKNVAFDAFFILAFFTNLCPIKSDLSGNTVWPTTTTVRIGSVWFGSVTAILARLTVPALIGTEPKHLLRFWQSSFHHSTLLGDLHNVFKWILKLLLKLWLSSIASHQILWNFMELKNCRKCIYLSFSLQINFSREATTWAQWVKITKKSHFCFAKICSFKSYLIPNIAPFCQILSSWITHWI